MNQVFKTPKQIETPIVYEEIITGKFRVWGNDIKSTLAVCRDRNLLHLDNDFARAQGFDGVIAPGMLVLNRLAGFVSRNFPDGTIIRELEKVKFLAPIYPGDGVFLAIQRKKVTPIHKGGIHKELITLSFRISRSRLFREDTLSVKGTFQIVVPVTA